MDGSREIDVGGRLAVLEEVFAGAVAVAAPAPGGWLTVRFQQDGAAHVTVSITWEQAARELISCYESRLRLFVPIMGLSAARWRAFAEGARLALRQFFSTEWPLGMPTLVAFDPAILRSSAVVEPEQFAAAQLDPDARSRALAALQVLEYGQSHGLDPVEDPPTITALWFLLPRQLDRWPERAESRAKWLAAGAASTARPYLERLARNWSAELEFGDDLTDEYRVLLGHLTALTAAAR